jgi:hypothetical protein
MTRSPKTKGTTSRTRTTSRRSSENRTNSVVVKFAIKSCLPRDRSPASKTDALALPLRESGIRFCACPRLCPSLRAPDSPAGMPRALGANRAGQHSLQVAARAATLTLCGLPTDSLIASGGHPVLHLVACALRAPCRPTSANEFLTALRQSAHRSDTVAQAQRYVAQRSLDWWYWAHVSHRCLASVSRMWLHRRSLGCSADDQRFLPWTLPWGREHGEKQIQIGLSFRSPRA